VMTLALFVYSVAQRRLRAQLVMHQETVPNQINQPTTAPTLRWVFQRPCISSLRLILAT
jgi:hypothetical protein